MDKKHQKYDSTAKTLALIIDIAIESIKKFPPKEFNSSHLEHFISVYLDLKNKALNPDSKFRNLTSLKYLENDALTYFQEGSGQDVDEFWKKIRESNIPLKRVNKLDKIFKRGKIKNQIEYDFVIDTFNSYIESNTLSEEEIKRLNEMISQFENSK